MTKAVVAGVVAGVGLLLVVAGCILIPVLDVVVQNTVYESVVFEEGTDAYDNLVNPASPTYTYFYFFNLTNMDEVLNNGSTPIVNEIGPYVYRTLKPKEDVQYRSEKTQIKYTFNSSYFFEPSLSNGDPYTDIVVNVNLIVLSVAYVYSTTGAGLIFGENFDNASIARNEQVFDSFIVNDYLWEYTEQTVIDSSTPNGQAINGLFYGNNNSLSGDIQVATGIIDVDFVNEMTLWKGVNFASTDDGDKMWNSPTANMLNGTDGTQYKPFIEKDDLLYTFSTDLCRAFKMLYDSEVDVRGINAYRFVLDPRNFDVTDDNVGFCLPDETKCLPKGLLNVEKCYGGTSPLVASLPHWLDVDPTIQERVAGMTPQKSLHETAIDIEPTTGISIRGNKRLQLSFTVKSMTYLTASQKPMFEGDGLIFPVFWLNEFTEISEADADDFKSEITGPIEMGVIIQYTLIGVGGFVMLVALILLTYFKCTASNSSKYV